MNTTNVRFATLLALLAALISGTNNFLTKIAVVASKDPVYYTTLKNALVAVFLVGLIIVLRKGGELRGLSKKQYGMLAAIGIIGGSVPFALYFTGLAMTSAINAGLIHKTLVLWVLLFAYPFLKERLSRGQLLGVFLVFMGNLFVGGFTGFKLNSGEFMILSATILWAIENIIAKKVLADISSMTVAAVRMTLGSVFLIGFLISSGRMTPLSVITPTEWGWALLTGVFLLGYVLTWYAALKRASATYVAALLVPATLITNALSAIFITHVWSGVQICALIFYVLGAGLLVYYGLRVVKTSALPTPTAALTT